MGVGCRHFSRKGHREQLAQAAPALTQRSPATCVFSALWVSELQLLHPVRECEFGLALPAHVLWLHKLLLLPTDGGVEPLGLCAAFSAVERGHLLVIADPAAVITP